MPQMEKRSRREEVNLHDDAGLGDRLFDRLVRQNADAVEVHFVSDFDVLSEDGDVFETRPGADSRLPADDGGLHPCVGLHFTVVHDSRSLEQDK